MATITMKRFDSADHWDVGEIYPLGEHCEKPPTVLAQQVCASVVGLLVPLSCTSTVWTGFRHKGRESKQWRRGPRGAVVVGWRDVVLRQQVGRVGQQTCWRTHLQGWCTTHRTHHQFGRLNKWTRMCCAVSSSQLMVAHLELCFMRRCIAPCPN
jgi:hypothetical protein